MCSISILMSTFNEPERFIRESVDSILAQTFSNFELIVVNDNPGRTDVKKILESYNDPRVVFIQNEQNLGLAMSMNKAAAVAKADILVRMDADDVAEKERLSLQYKILTTKDCDFVYSSYIRINEDSNVVSPFKHSLGDEFGTNVSLKVALNPSCIHHPTVMMTRAVFEKVGGYRDFPCAQDADLWLRLQEVGCRFYKIDRPLIRYRINSQSVSKKKWFKQRLTWYYIFNLSIERLRHDGQDSYSLANYNQMLKKQGINNPKKEERLRVSYNYLQKALVLNGTKRLYYRMLAFLSHPILRRHLLNVFYKKYHLK